MRNLLAVAIGLAVIVLPVFAGTPLQAHDVSAVESGDIPAGAAVIVIYDGTQWQQISQSGN